MKHLIKFLIIIASLIIICVCWFLLIPSVLMRNFKILDLHQAALSMIWDKN